MQENNHSRLATLLCGSALAISITSLPCAAHAQTVAQENEATSPPEETTPAAAEPTASVADIVVTGSRILRDGAASPTPVTVVSAEQLQLAAPSTLTDGLNQLPAFRGSSRPQAASSIGLNSGGQGGNYLNLRNLGVQRTLVLLDGRRTAPTSLNGAVDANILPQILVSRVDTVTGGASAAYGSDAVSGVVNFVLDNKFTGLKGEVNAGVSSRGDNGSRKIALAGGKDFADGRGHVLLSGEYFKSDGLADYSKRDWADGPAIGPSSIIVTDATLSLASDGGKIVGVVRPNGTAITGDPLTRLQFLPGGAVGPFDNGTNQSANFQQGGDGSRQTSSLVAGLERYNLFGRASYDLTDNLNVFAEGTYGYARSTFTILPPFNYNSSVINIFNGNPFIPPSLQSTIDARNSDANPVNDVGSIRVGRLNTDFGNVRSDVRTRSWRALTGFDLGLGDWDVGGYYAYSDTKVETAYRNNVIVSRLAAALDVVRGAGGAPVCRAQPAPQISATSGAVVSPPCVPLNIFGSGSPSQAALDYIHGDNVQKLDYRQHLGELNIKGSPFATWAGPVSLGAGVAFRRESATNSVDPYSDAPVNLAGLRTFGPSSSLGNYLIGNPQAIAGSNTIKEGYLEVVVPLLNDSAVGKSLDLNGAIRYADYKLGGGATTWKLGAVYEPVDGVRLRVTRSRDIRAANIGELFASNTQSQGTVRLADGTTRSYISFGGGNRSLRPEKADTFTAGVALKPGFLPGFTATVDYYNIRIDGVIGALTVQQTYDECRNGSATACANISDNGARLVIQTPQLNLQSLATRGVDLELGWRGPALGGTLGIRGLIGYLDKYQLTVPGGTPIDYAGEVGQTYANPRWTATASVNYKVGNFGLFVQERYIGPGTYNATLVEGVTINDNSIPSRWYTDVTARVRLNAEPRSPELFLTVNNLFDKEPPIAPLALGTIMRPTNPLLYDVVGRYMTMGFKFRF